MAVRLWAELSVMVQVPVPVHEPPLQPVNVDPPDGEAVNVTVVPVGNMPEQPLVLQDSPAGELLTVPVPPPLNEIDS